MNHQDSWTSDKFKHVNVLYVPRRSTRTGRSRNPKPKTSLASADKWPNGIVYYKIANSLAKFRNNIGTAMKKIESTTCIRFKPRDKRQSDYVSIINGNGCHSIVGRARGMQVLSLGYGCRDVGSIIHELCHAIGLYHEHMRYDRDQYLQINWKNIDPSMFDQFEKIPISEYRPASKFDYNSIMIYGSKAFSKNGRDTMTPRDPRAFIKESHFKNKLSQADILNINAMYHC